MNKNQLILGCIIAFVVFLYSLELTSFSGYTILGLVVIGIILYFGLNYVMYMLQEGKSITVVIITIIIAGIIGVFAWGGYKIYENKKKINKKWTQYRCKPYMLPFAGWAVGPGDVSVTTNFVDCMWNINKTFFDILISPFTEILQVITGILSSMVNDIQNIRKMVTYMRDNMEEMAKDVLNKIWASYVRIAYLFKTFLKVFKRLGDVFVDLFDVLKFSTYTVASMWNGPVGGIAHFFCFDEDTMIKLDNSNYKKIKDIKLGDILEDNNQVTGFFKFDAKNVDMYYYKNVIVSGKHPVKENEKWLRIEESIDSRKVEYHKPYIYCLATQNAVIKVNNIIFSDYIDTSDPEMKKNIYQYVLKKLNN